MALRNLGLEQEEKIRQEIEGLANQDTSVRTDRIVYLEKKVIDQQVQSQIFKKE